MASFFKGNQLYRQDVNGHYRKVNDLTPIHHWKLQEGFESFINDSSLVPQSLTSANTGVNPSGRIGISREFNGTTSYAYGTLSDSLKTNEGSISIWANFGTVANNQESALSIANNTLDTRFAIRRKLTQEVVECYLRIGAVNKWFIEASTQLTNGGWKHIVITHDGISPKIYINGVDLTTITGSADLTAWIGDGIFDNISLGSIYFSSTRFIDFEGSLEDVRLYDRALTGQEIAIIYNEGNGTHSQSLIRAYPTRKSLIHHWKLQEESGTTVNDSSSSPSSLTNSNCIINQSGITTKAYEFNGTNSKCEAILPTNMKTATGSFAMWANFGDTVENTEALISVSKPNENTRFVIRRSGTNESIAVLCQESGTYAWNFSFNYQLTNAGWLHIAITQDGTAPKAYVNSVEQSITFSVDTNKTKWLTYANMNTFNLGVTRAMGDYGFFKGKMFDVRYYDYPLQKYEIENLYNMGNGILIT